MNENEYPPVMTIDQACQFLQISRPTMFALLKKNKIGSKKVGNQHRFLRKELEDYVSSKMENK